GCIHLLAVADGLAHAHVDDDLLQPRNLHHVPVAELLPQGVAQRALVERLHARLVVGRPWRRRRRRSLALARAPLLVLAPRRGALAGSGSALAALAGGRLAGAGRLAALALLVLRHRYLASGICSPDRLATRTLRPSSRTVNRIRVGWPSLGSSSARFDRWIGASLE